MLEQISGHLLNSVKIEKTAAAPEQPRRAPLHLDRQFRELDLDFDAATGVFWCRFRFSDRPSFTPGVLQELRRVRQMLASRGDTAEPQVRYVVLGSRMPGVFNLGGDLGLFAQLIRRRDRDALATYARACVAEIHANSVALDLPVITMSLVQGDALGGGFEAALSANVIVAERSAKFGLPEVMFNLFPGMGAYNFLARRSSAAVAEKLIMSGRVHTGAELYDMGIVDVLAEDGEGEEVLLDYVRKNGRRHAAHRAIYQARQRVNPITLQDLNEITDLWVDTALTLGPADLRMMERLVAAQDRRRARTGTALAEDLRLGGVGD
ncbi:crotonase/enoyl-CoA hydratase family protein [Skermanella sp. TT6]|uniref:Crotonase/enoyl-CoA hydratase family protein n=1 Tax=Skermanella cutis TaxID=2775420 RepID=A0ABX7B731_9PROT|nr:crotonase/enoyl-CoA hydratase family protein [Skermanella sp. TT6]QQP90190.1 crotonase/enoyl-CoA hydratase family protein [Skermanella sp. TT6]